MNQLVSAIASQRWLITSDGMLRVLSQLPDLTTGDFIGDLFAARPEAVASRNRGSRAGSVAVVYVRGPIVRYDSWFTMLFGGTSVEWLAQQVRELAQDEAVGSIFLDIDSPGGTIDGLPELAASLRAARAQKPMLALTDPVQASAAYWIGAQADEIVSTPEGLTGSVGVYTEHWDLSAMLEAEGIGHEFIQAGRFKTEGNEFAPLSDEAREHIQGIVDDGYGLFLADVAKGRGVTVGQVKSDYGEGRILTAKDAKAKGLIDRIDSFAGAMGRASTGKIARRTAVDVPGLRSESPLPDPTPDPEPEPPDAFAFERERRQREGKRPITSAADSAGAFRR